MYMHRRHNKSDQKHQKDTELTDEGTCTENAARMAEMITTLKNAPEAPNEQINVHTPGKRQKGTKRIPNTWKTNTPKSKHQKGTKRVPNTWKTNAPKMNGHRKCT